MNQIPKIIHYCWFGGNPLPELALKCIASWKKFCPDYEIVRWDESSFDINCCDYVREAYEAKKWAFVSDVARLYALVEHGGIYMDTDVEIVRPLDEFLQYEAFSGFERKNAIPTGLMAAKANHPLFVELLHEYAKKHFVKEDGTYDLTTNVVFITDTCLKYGLKLNNSIQTVNRFTLFPSDYFCPINEKSGKLELTNNTYTIHHFAGSWVDPYSKFRGKVYKFLYRNFGEKVANAVKKVVGRKK